MQTKTYGATRSFPTEEMAREAAQKVRSAFPDLIVTAEPYQGVGVVLIETDNVVDFRKGWRLLQRSK